VAFQAHRLHTWALADVVQAYGRRAVATGQVPHEEVMLSLHQHLQALAAGEEAIQPMRPEDASRALSGFAGSRFSPSEVVLRAAEAALLAAVTEATTPPMIEASSRAPSLLPRVRSEAAAAFANLGRCSTAFRSALRDEAVATAALGFLGAEEAATLIWALSALGVLDPKALSALLPFLPEGQHGPSPSVTPPQSPLISRLHLPFLDIAQQQQQQQCEEVDCGVPSEFSVVIPTALQQAARRRWLAETLAVADDRFQTEVRELTNCAEQRL
jgi:hypothetical protein